MHKSTRSSFGNLIFVLWPSIEKMYPVVEEKQERTRVHTLRSKINSPPFLLRSLAHLTFDVLVEDLRKPLWSRHSIKVSQVLIFLLADCRVGGRAGRGQDDIFLKIYADSHATHTFGIVDLEVTASLVSVLEHWSIDREFCPRDEWAVWEQIC